MEERFTKPNGISNSKAANWFVLLEIKHTLRTATSWGISYKIWKLSVTFRSCLNEMLLTIIHAQSMLLCYQEWHKCDPKNYIHQWKITHTCRKWSVMSRPFIPTIIWTLQLLHILITIFSVVCFHSQPHELLQDAKLLPIIQKYRVIPGQLIP